MSVAGRRFPWLAYVLALIVILLLALWPLIGVAVASYIAETHGCVLHEGNYNPCLVGGEDWGRTLYAFFVLGWFMIATIPLGGLALLVWLVVLVVHLLYRRRRAAPSP